MIHFGVIHATIRVRHTLPECIASLYAAGVNYVSVFPDVGVYGAMRNLDRALWQLIQMAGEKDHVCVVDDDLVVCKDALLIMEEGLQANEIRSFYTVAHTVRHLTEEERANVRGWYQIKPNFGDGWGGMLVLPRAVAIEVVNHTYWRRYAQTDIEGKKCDAVLYETLRYLGHLVNLHLPSLAGDIGHGISTIGNEHTPETQGVRFDEWTAQ